MFAPMQRVKQLYCQERRAEQGPIASAAVQFIPGVEEITSDLDMSKEYWIKDGWNLCPLNSFCVRGAYAQVE